MRNATYETFSKDVLEPSNRTPIVVIYHASWCGPCKALKPMLERLAESLAFTFVGVDAGEEKVLAAVENVRGVPTVKVYKDGAAIGSFSGSRTETDVRDFLYKHGVTQNALEF